AARSASKPTGTGPLAGGPRASADRARRRQPLLAAVLRNRPGENAGGFRRTGRSAQPPRAARLAGHGIRAHWLGRQGHAASDRYLGDVSTGISRDHIFARARSRESPARTRPAPAPDRRDD